MSDVKVEHILNVKDERDCVVEESNQVKRSRGKLQALIDEQKDLINENTIQMAKEKNAEQYHRNVSLRVSGGADKPLRLFAQGEGVELTVSPKIERLAEQLLQEIQRDKDLHIEFLNRNVGG